MKKNLFSITLLFTILYLFVSCAPSPRYSSSKGRKSNSSTRSSSKKTSKKVAGRHALSGHASWYGPGFQGKKTANGERFNMHAMTAAHKTLPFGTKVEVTAVKTGKKVVVRINDRGPFIKGRVIDLSKKAAKKLGILKSGHGKVKIRIIR